MSKALQNGDYKTGVTLRSGSMDFKGKGRKTDGGNGNENAEKNKRGDTEGQAEK